MADAPEAEDTGYWQALAGGGLTDSERQQVTEEARKRAAHRAGADLFAEVDERDEGARKGKRTINQL